MKRREYLGTVSSSVVLPFYQGRARAEATIESVTGRTIIDRHEGEFQPVLEIETSREVDSVTAVVNGKKRTHAEQDDSTTYWVLLDKHESVDGTVRTTIRDEQGTRTQEHALEVDLTAQYHELADGRHARVSNKGDGILASRSTAAIGWMFDPTEHSEEYTIYYADKTCLPDTTVGPQAASIMQAGHATRLPVRVESVEGEEYEADLYWPEDSLMTANS